MKNLSFKVKVKVICYLLISSNAYSYRDDTLEPYILELDPYVLEDDEENCDNLMKFIKKSDIIDQYADILKGPQKIEDALLKILNELFTENENTPRNIYDLVGSFDNDFNHSFMPRDAVEKLSPNVKKFVQYSMLRSNRFIHLESSPIFTICKSINDPTTFNLDELLEYSIFIAKYGKHSGIGYIRQLNYYQNDPYSVFDNKLEFEKLFE